MGIEGAEKQKSINMVAWAIAAWWVKDHFSLSRIGEGNGNPLQCSCLKNPRDRGAWWAAIYGIAQSWTRLKRLSNSSSSKGGRIHKISDIWAALNWWIKFHWRNTKWRQSTLEIKIWRCLQAFETTRLEFSSFQSLSCVRLFVTPWVAARQASLSENVYVAGPRPGLLSFVVVVSR